jgi:hypothetical protein
MLDNHSQLSSKLSNLRRKYHYFASRSSQSGTRGVAEPCRVIGRPPPRSLLATFAVNMVILGLCTAAWTTSPYNVDFSLPDLQWQSHTFTGTNLLAATLAISNPLVAARQHLSFPGELGRIAIVRRKFRAAAKDKRFADPATGSSRWNYEICRRRRTFLPKRPSSSPVRGAASAEPLG